mmetsp:Transcript_27949/g.73741  ORF Transcript_27949/g.73741 Transcript_27949/m.73741 type:complete len:156 (-) Transcript_27949:409-876(-)
MLVLSMDCASTTCAGESRMSLHSQRRTPRKVAYASDAAQLFLPTLQLNQFCSTQPKDTTAISRRVVCQFITCSLLVQLRVEVLNHHMLDRVPIDFSRLRVRARFWVQSVETFSICFLMGRETLKLRLKQHRIKGTRQLTRTRIFAHQDHRMHMRV